MFIACFFRGGGGGGGKKFDWSYYIQCFSNNYPQKQFQPAVRQNSMEIVGTRKKYELVMFSPNKADRGKYKIYFLVHQNDLQFETKNLKIYFEIGAFCKKGKYFWKISD